MSATVKVLIADDQPLVRRGLALMLAPEPGFQVVAEAADGAEAVRLAHEHRPHVVVMDIRMPVLDGIAATERLTAELPDCRVLALSTFDMDEHVVGALRAGACGFLPKDISPEDLVAALRVVRDGEAILAPRLLTRLISQHVTAPDRRAAPPVPSGAEGLTPREREVWRLIAGGSDNAEIADRLGLSASTVKNHITALFAKLRVRDRAQAVIAAYETGLVTARRER
ncbi:response regulator transcription factor [Streptomyces sp. WAC05374]|uniref:response regulator n=1 Tax=Streptomyces sp. WAC05374 TaxID=2487420 RepID=UPI000F898203|nr:response regulator transcription factor [Streptomyces sp. WAC05374]RST18976.1 DNA-binding response regulator [Streptomyces sp. WAC05374]TDF50660.1 response regulator transcription factor [Streptomyces sp. WAC05374]TDF56950.1 response regulator transcription factor [Streptomyces sp. WAC05374]TDF60913.1 response regulator transcription factor [Streptomyces sp. WAC05374]